MKLRVRTPLRALVLGGTCAFMVAGAAATGLAADIAARAGTITVYSGQHEQTVSKLVADFTKRTGIQVKVRSADEATLANQILQEGSKSPADVFFAENPPALQVLVGAGPARAGRPGHAAPRCRAHAARRRATGSAVSARAAVLAYNTDKLTKADLPESLLDLASPAWKGRVAFAPAETDFQPLITSIAKLRGNAAALAWLKASRRTRRSTTTTSRSSRPSTTARSPPVSSTTTTGTGCATRSARDNTHSALHYFAAARPGHARRRLRRGGPEVEQARRRRPSASSPTW